MKNEQDKITEWLDKEADIRAEEREKSGLPPVKPKYFWKGWDCKRYHTYLRMVKANVAYAKEAK